MANGPFLAMTGLEIAENPGFSGKQAWMACHFSPEDTGLSNLPQVLKEGSVLMLNDQLPFQGHDFHQIANQLSDRMEALHCCCLLLDFQRPDWEEAKNLAEYLSKTIPHPVVVSAVYARELDCPVFLPPVPPSVALRTHLAPWDGRDIWLEIGLDGERITLTEQGAEATLFPRFAAPETGFFDSKLHCHYQVDVMDTQVQFTLWRSREDLKDLLIEAETFGITTTVGLFQELSIQ